VHLCVRDAAPEAAFPRSASSIVNPAARTDRDSQTPAQAVDVGSTFRTQTFRSDRRALGLKRRVNGAKWEADPGGIALYTARSSVIYLPGRDGAGADIA